MEPFNNIMEKEELIESLKSNGFSKSIIKAFKKVKRERYVPPLFEKYVYEDSPIPIGFGQTVSQPYTIAIMFSLLEIEDNQKILEIGSGSGYVLELLATLSKRSEIYGVERIKELAEQSKKNLSDYKNVRILNQDGSKGLKEKAPFDRIIVSAASTKLPYQLIDQLKVNGILVAPVGNSLVQIKKDREDIKSIEGFQFVPLIED